MNKIVYVVGSEQSLHFEQLKAISSLLNLKVDISHVKFGLISLPEGKMSTRKGNVILLDDVIDKLLNLSVKILEEKGLSKNKTETAKDIAIGALVYADLSNDRINDISFKWNKILDFNGNSAPYIQYTYARASSLLDKEKISKKWLDLLTQQEEIKLIKILSFFEENVIMAYNQNKPNILANYAFSLSQSFNEFYQKCPVLKTNNDLKKARLSLVYSFKIVLSNTMKLLNIKLPNKM